MTVKTTNQLQKVAMISLLAGLVGLTGCATTGDRDKLQAQIDCRQCGGQCCQG